MSHFNSLVGESTFSQPNQSNQFRSTRTEDQNPLLIPKPGKLKPVDMHKGAGSSSFPKPLMVKPNFTVNSLETRFNPPVSSNRLNSDSRRDAVGVKLPNREQQENSYTESPSAEDRPCTPAKPSVMQKLFFHEDISAAPGTATDDLSVPKPKPLPSVFALGKCPAKPERPPHVNINKFRGNVSNTNNPELDPGMFPLPPPPEHLSITSMTPPPPPPEHLSITSMTPPPPPPEHLSITSMTPPPPEHLSITSMTPPPQPPEHLSITSMTPSPPPDFTLPPAPPPMDQTLQEDFYDDTDTMHRTPTSLGKSSNDHESGEEIYEDLEDIDHNWPEDNKETIEEKTTKESKELKKKLEKEEKKRLEQEKKEKKDREKRQQEARKKFKIKGTIAVVDTVKARVDHKGGKNKLPLKQGETIEIVRRIENPKDYWLARNTEGHYGFVKPDTLDVRGEVRHTQDGQEVYDDVGAAGHEVNNFLPPPPPADFEFNVVDAADDMYDDVIPTDFPPPPPPCSNPKVSSTSETNVMDPKTRKKFEKEEKEFRKKFKYNAEIKVLYQATVLPSLSMKKFGNKDLPIKPREMIDVIVHPVDDKLICRNSKGKFGYVSTANLEQDESVYDDVDDECIYDND